MNEDIVSWSESKFGFYVDRHYENGRWKLKKAPIKLSDYHKRILSHIFREDENGKWPYDTIAWCEPAKSGKSAIAGLVSEYVALHGEKNSSIVMASNKQNQAASLMFKSLTDSVEFNPHLPNVDSTRFEMTFSNGNQVKAIPSNSKGEAGARFSLALFDELWGYVYEDSLRLWAEFKHDPTRQNSLKFAIGYAGYSGESELWQNLLETGIQGEVIEELSDIVNEDGSPCCYRNGRQFTFWSHVPRQEWQTKAWLDSQAKSLTPAEFRRMIKTEFSPFTEQAFIEEASWDSCYNSLVQPIVAGDKTPLVVALDLSLGGLGNDTISMLGVSKWGNDGYAVKFIRSYEATSERFDYDETAGKELMWLLANCNVTQVCYDIYQAHHFIKPFTHQVWTSEFSQQSERNIADKNLYDLIASKKLQHDGNPLLKRHIMNAGSKAADDNKLRLLKTHSRKKIDLAVCLSMACYRAGKLNLTPDPASIDKTAKILELAEQRGLFIPRQKTERELIREFYKEYDKELPIEPGPVLVGYLGGLADGSVEIETLEGRRKVFAGQIYNVTGQVWSNLQRPGNGFRQGSWVRLHE